MSVDQRPWYILLPNGQIARTGDTESIRHYLQVGTLPRDGQFRRAPNEPWRNIDAFHELSHLDEDADTRPETSSGVSSRLAGIRTLGIRDIGQELLAALDLTLVASKITIGCATAVIALTLGFGVQWLATLVGAGTGLFAAWGMIAIQLAVLAIGTTILARYGHRELSEMRQVRWDEARSGMQLTYIRVLIAYWLVPGVMLGLLALFPYLPTAWSESAIATKMGSPIAPAITAVIQIAGLFLSVVIWFLIGLTWLIAPILAVEECSVMRGLREWRQLLRDHWGQVILYEAAALMLGGVASIPHLIPVLLSLRAELIPANDLGILMQRILMGFAVGPWLAYMATANVFIYLNLRYENR